MPTFINVPQGCYAEVSASTPTDIIGLCTFGIFDCCHVIVANPTSGYFVLCHADEKTNLEDLDHGAPAWVRKACPDGDYSNLKINLGEEAGGGYYERVKRSIDLIINPATQIAIEFTEARGISVDRNFDILIAEGVSLEDLQEKINSKPVAVGIQEIVLPSEEYEGDRTIGGSIGNARDRAAIRDKEGKAPICIFRGSAFLTIDEMQADNPSINFRRVTADKGLDTDSSPNTSDRDSKHLVRSEKISFTQKAKFIDILCEDLSEEAKAKIVNMRKEPYHQFEPSTFSSNAINAQPNVTLIPENNHEADHRHNTQKLTQGIIEGKIKGDTVIGLERKEVGINFGMQDVVLLANILEHNKCEAIFLWSL